MKIKRWSSDSGYNSKFLIKRRRQRRPLRALVFSVAFLLICGAFAWAGTWAANYPYFRVHTVTVSGLRAIGEGEVRERIAASLAGTKMFFVPNDNILLLSSGELAAGLSASFPRAKSISVTKDYPDAIAVTVEERPLWGLACSASSLSKPAEKGEELPVSATGQIIFDEDEPVPADEAEAPALSRNCVLIDDKGFAFGAFEGLGEGVLPVIYTDIGKDVSSGQLVGEDYIAYFESARTQLHDKTSLDIIGLALEDENPKDYKVIMAGGWYVLVPKADDIASWVGQLKTLLATKLKDGTDGVEYIDLRFGNKVFYKLKGE